MADTGAPWNIPYAEPADLVRDWPALSEDVADAVAAGLDEAAVIAQVLSVSKTDTFTTTSTSFTAVTGLSVTITPKTATNKVLVIVQTNVSGSADVFLRLSGGNSGTYVGDAAGSRTRIATGLAQFNGSNLNLGTTNIPASIVFLDAPASGSAVTYGVEARVTTGTAVLNRSSSDTDGAAFPRTASSITVIEVVA